MWRHAVARVAHRCSPSSRAASSMALMRDAESCANFLTITWSDGSESRFHHAWLRDHCPQSLHPVSGQREFALRQLPAQPVPQAVAVEQHGRTLALRWPETTHTSSHESTFDAAWLWDLKYDHRLADGASASPSSSAGREAPHRRRSTLWRPTDLGPLDGLSPATSWTELNHPGARGERAVLSCLRRLESLGFCLVADMPTTAHATTTLATALGQMQPTFYGSGIWDTAPLDADAVVDTAYSNVELPLHTDCTYLQHAPGLQLFCAVEQPPPTDTDPLAGCTKLCDGLMAADVLRHTHPDAFAFFCRAQLPFHHCEGDVHMRNLAPVFDVDALSAQVVGVRYNETDRAPLNSLSFDDVSAFYKHVHALEATFDSLLVSLRLNPGTALVVDNHRVLHGRYGFVGRRSLIGCYLTADDWRSNLRVLEARHAGQS